jgi:peptidoglycan-associated lipoprotein
MKRSILIHSLLLCVILAVGGTGCKKTGKGLTPIPGAKPSITSQPPRPSIGGTDDLNARARGLDTTTITPPSTEGIPSANRELFDDREADREMFKSDILYFDYDRSAIRSSETSKLQAVAEYLKQNAKDDLAIEGHCDERGTPEYNRSLGERRALSAREYLVNLGIASNRIRTISYGEDKPADPGHDEAAWAKNRRCEFLRLLPKSP